jgi:hypothetical protein
VTYLADDAFFWLSDDAFFWLSSSFPALAGKYYIAHLQFLFLFLPTLSLEN